MSDTDQCTAVVGPWVRRKVVATPPVEDLGNGVWQSGRGGLLLGRIVDLIDAADRIVVLCSFILDCPEVEQAITRATARDVHVYVMTASEKRLRADTSDLVGTNRAKAHTALLDRLADKVAVRTASGFHAKVLLVDPNDDAVGMLLTANVVDHSLSESVELGIELTGDEVRAAFSALRWGYWEGAEHELRGPGRLVPLSPSTRVDIPQPAAGVVWACGGQDHLTRSSCDAVQAASDIIATNYGWATDHPVVESLHSRAQTAKVFAVGRAHRRAAHYVNALASLQRAGADVRGSTHQHAKVLVLDRRRALVSSMNWVDIPTPSRLELGVWLEEDRAASVLAAVDGWMQGATARLP